MSVIAGASQPAEMVDTVLRATRKIDIGLGVVPLDTYSSAELSTEISRRRWPLKRVILGVGAGSSGLRSLKVVREGLTRFRRRHPDLRLAVGGYGPRVLFEAGRRADAICLAWMTPSRLRAAMARVALGCQSVGRSSRPSTYLYVRCAAGPQAHRRIEQELKGSLARVHHQASATQQEEHITIATDSVHHGGLSPLALPEGVTPVFRGLPADPGSLESWLELVDLFAQFHPTVER